MTTDINILDKILKARENRAFLRKNISEKNVISISLSLNIPGYPKSNELITSFFEQILSELEIYLYSNRICVENSEKIIDEAGNFWISAINTNNISEFEIKLLTEKFEENHNVGRIIDVDITNVKCENVSSGKAKKCIICDLPAIVCMRNNNHSNIIIRNIIFDLITNYLSEIRKEKIIHRITEIAIKSLLYEVSLTPKPGLVDFEKNGSHNDMDYFTFLNSTAALSPYFSELAKKGFDFKDDFKNALPVIRNIGLQMESAMFKATNGVNTQKGLIFLLGLSIFSAANIYSNYHKIDYRIFEETIKKICFKLFENELNNSSNFQTHGEISFKKFGKIAGGARLEAELGFPTVFNFGLPVFENELKKVNKIKKENINFALQKTLISIISENNDTNILFRKDEKVLENLKSIAKKVLNEKIKYSELEKFCKSENISPGGSADLLAITVFIYFVKDVL